MASCEWCGSALTPMKRQGNRKRFCNPTCQHASRPRRASAHAPRSTVAFPTCHFCEQVFTARRAPRGDRATCSDAECRRALKREQMREYAAMVAEREGIPYSTHLARAGKKVGRWHLTVARRLAIYERDGWTCRLCLRPVDPTLDPNDDMAASVDHIVPRSEGGPHDESNLRLAHRWCNTVRWSRPDLDLTRARLPHGGEPVPAREVATMLTNTRVAV